MRILFMGTPEFAVDSLRRRFGADVVKRAVFLNRAIDHMCGGVPESSAGA